MAQTGKSKRSGWLPIVIVATVMILLLVLGTMDASTRYDLIGV